MLICHLGDATIFDYKKHELILGLRDMARGDIACWVLSGLTGYGLASWRAGRAAAAHFWPHLLLEDQDVDGARGPVSAADWAGERDDGALGSAEQACSGPRPGGLRPQMRRIVCARSTSFLGEVRTSALASGWDSCCCQCWPADVIRVWRLRSEHQLGSISAC